MIKGKVNFRAQGGHTDVWGCLDILGASKHSGRVQMPHQSDIPMPASKVGYPL